MTKESTAPIMLFDGVCNLCSGVVQFILKHERTSIVRFASLQSDIATQLLAQHKIDAVKTDSIVFIENGNAFIKSKAAFKIARHLAMPWRMASWFSFVPRWLGDPVYDLIARNRYRMFGKKEACWIPQPTWRDRSLDQVQTAASQM